MTGRLQGKWQRTKRAFQSLGWYFTSKSRCAARYKLLTSCTWTDAGRMFGVNPGAVLLATRRIQDGR